VVGSRIEKQEGDPHGLPSDRAFVLQFRRLADFKENRIDGRVEHMTTGQAIAFHSLEELMKFLAENLSSN